MTIKKQWLLVLVLIAIFSVIINSLILSTLTNQYFKDYMKDNYNKHLNQIVEYLSGALKDENYSENQIAIKLETHLTDPITRIKVYDNNGVLITDVSADVQSYVTSGMMSGMMGNIMGRMRDTQFEEVDHAEIINGDAVIGQVNITKYSSAENSFATWMFQSSLLKNSLYSIGIVLIFAVIIGMIISKRMSKDLIQTAEMAQNIDIGNVTPTRQSKVKEIRVIQQSLESLQSRLKLKQKSRKALIDQLVHQTRTPLTILRTHLEGIEDGVIDIVPEEIRICENQIENITAIISNMSSLIDAEKLETTLNIEEFEMNQLVKQIVNGLKAQFDKKGIDFKITDHKKVSIKTDKYRLSQAIYNILTNAYKFTEPNGNVYISYHVNSDNIILTIEDNGPGISKEDQAKIFDAYYKKDISIGSAGDGIGLYVAKENMTIIHGTITVDSDLPMGSKFILTIPMII
jgi:signal transduction histidine kinase